jgi:hypothetical protein
MATYRSERARRRAEKLRNTRLLVIFLILAAVGLSAYFLFFNKPPEVTVPVLNNPQTTNSGLKYEDLVIGEGALAEPGKTLQVHYTGWLLDGTKFDSSLDRGQPFSLVLGAGQVIPGWDEGLVGMRVGGKRRLEIPPELGYGASGAGNLIPPNADLIFEVELLGVQ